MFLFLYFNLRILRQKPYYSEVPTGEQKDNGYSNQALLILPFVAVFCEHVPCVYPPLQRNENNKRQQCTLENVLEIMCGNIIKEYLGYGFML